MNPFSSIPQRVTKPALSPLLTSSNRDGHIFHAPRGPPAPAATRDGRDAHSKQPQKETKARSNEEKKGRVPHSLPRCTMSGMPGEDDGNVACANCGKVSSDDVKLKNCTACRLVKYCGVDCQRAHRKQHKGACKKRVAELKDEQLYSQGHERPEGDFCPICTLPIPLLTVDHSFFKACCIKLICHGCNVAAKKRGFIDCPFCKTPPPDTEAAMMAMIQARVEKKDPDAIDILGEYYCHGKLGQLGLQKDMRKAIQL